MSFRRSERSPQEQLTLPGARPQLMKLIAFANKALFKMTPSLLLSMIKKKAVEDVPFAKHIGIEVTEVAPGSAVALVRQREPLSNHIGTTHAAVIFAAGEAASGAAMAATLGEVILSVKPVASNAQIKYLKPASGVTVAKAMVKSEPAALLADLQRNGKVSFAVQVNMFNSSDVEVAAMTVEWHVRARS